MLTTSVDRLYVHSVGSQITWTKNVSLFSNKDIHRQRFFAMLSCRLGVSRWSGQRNGKRRLSRFAESGERAKPGGHGGRGLDAARSEASEGGLLFLLGEPSREPQKEEEQEQTQVHKTHLRQGVGWSLLLHLFPVWSETWKLKLADQYLQFFVFLF